ncbi:Regulator of protease activity HflC, stomatin/prohibitin superfamily [Dyella sp. OK004]|uniref:prohibitin family protein n=1 Tax=Dyella sp. OK004 TaxID=1855292 RepID=UPI0008EFB50E|nr:prohibitin family protein [Dyella sp. OK004]SFS17163.1 Regulator of protease activity HflC, stomatin/prohibitin superfamily [Dyella sp. OK004]
MKRPLMMCLALSTLMLAACDKVPAGHVGVKFQMYGDGKGSLQELPPGRYWVGWGYEMYTFPTFTQTYTFTRSANEGRPVDESLSFQTAQGLIVNADVGITYHIDPAKVTLIFQKYRKGIDEITDIYLRNMVRDALVKEASGLEIESVYGKGKARLIDAVQQDVAAEVAPVGIVVEKIYWVGELRLPDNVVQSINAKIQATQMAEQRQNEVAQARAEAQKVEAEAQGKAQAQLTIAQADAKAISLKGEALRQNPNVVQMSAIEKWDGHLPTYNGSGALPFVNLTAHEASK